MSSPEKLIFQLFHQLSKQVIYDQVDSPFDSAFESFRLPHWNTTDQHELLSAVAAAYQHYTFHYIAPVHMELSLAKGPALHLLNHIYRRGLCEAFEVAKFQGLKKVIDQAQDALREEQHQRWRDHHLAKISWEHIEDRYALAKQIKAYFKADVDNAISDAVLAINLRETILQLLPIVHQRQQLFHN